MNAITIHFRINGKDLALESLPGRTLLDILRDDFDRTGAKDACGGEGECGACTVIMNGKAVNSCLVLAGQLEGCDVITIEGIKDHPLQQAFTTAGAVQCGFCTPGAILAAKALLDENPDPDESAIREALSGNLCRCTGYTKMVQAVQLAAREMQHG